MCSTVLNVDISFNEPVVAIEMIALGESESVHAYAFEELVAEKLRALLQ